MLDDQVLNTFDPHKEDQILYLPFCCGDPMDGLSPNTMDVSGEKALAVYANCGLHGLGSLRWIERKIFRQIFSMK